MGWRREGIDRLVPEAVGQGGWSKGIGAASLGRDISPARARGRAVPAGFQRSWMCVRTLKMGENSLISGIFYV